MLDGITKSRAGFTLLETLIASALAGGLVLLAFSFFMNGNRFVSGQTARGAAEQDLERLLTGVQRDLYESSGYFDTVTSKNVGYPAMALDQSPDFPSPATTPTGGTFTELSAPCSGIIIFQDYPKQTLGQVTCPSTVTPQAIAYRTSCYGSATNSTGLNIPYSRIPAMQSGLQSGTASGSGAGLNCASTQTPVVYRERWYNYPCSGLPSYPVQIVNPVASAGATSTLNYFTLTSGPDVTTTFPPFSSNPNGTGYHPPNGEAGMSLCAKFINEGGGQLQRLVTIILEGAALYRASGSKFGVVRKSLNVPFFNRDGSVHPVVRLCASTAQGC